MMMKMMMMDHVKLWWKLNDIGNYNDKVIMMMWNWWWQCEINDDNMWWCGIDNVKLMIMMMTWNLMMMTMTMWKFDDGDNDNMEFDNNDDVKFVKFDDMMMMMWNLIKAQFQPLYLI